MSEYESQELRGVLPRGTGTRLRRDLYTAHKNARTALAVRVAQAYPRVRAARVCDEGTPWQVENNLHNMGIAPDVAQVFYRNALRRDKEGKPRCKPTMQDVATVYPIRRVGDTTYPLVFGGEEVGYVEVIGDRLFMAIYQANRGIRNAWGTEAAQVVWKHLESARWGYTSGAVLKRMSEYLDSPYRVGSWGNPDVVESWVYAR